MTGTFRRHLALSQSTYVVSVEFGFIELVRQLFLQIKILY